MPAVAEIPVFEYNQLITRKDGRAILNPHDRRGKNDHLLFVGPSEAGESRAMRTVIEQEWDHLGACDVFFLTSDVTWESNRALWTVSTPGPPMVPEAPDRLPYPLLIPDPMPSAQDMIPDHCAYV